jgi:hypothetical protein
MTNVSHNLGDTIAALSGITRDVQRAERSAIGTTTTWAKKQMQSRMIELTNMPGRVFKRFRVSSRTRLQAGTVFLGLNPIKSAYLGKLTQETAGSWAGDYYFEGAFVQKMKSGHTSIFKKKGTAIEEQTAIIEDVGFPLGARVAREAEHELERRFAAKLMELNPHIY